MNRESAMTMPQVMIVLSILLVAGTLVSPSVGEFKRSALEIKPCEQQLRVISQAIRRYRQTHAGRDPWPIGCLAEAGYVTEKSLICPRYLARRFDDVVSAVQEVKENAGAPWSSYFLYHRPAFDWARAEGTFAVGYTEVLEKRKGDTPLVLCLEHRESYARRPTGEKPKTLWADRDAPLLILRYDGRISRSYEPGTREDNDFPGTEEILRDF